MPAVAADWTRLAKKPVPSPGVTLYQPSEVVMMLTFCAFNQVTASSRSRLAPTFTRYMLALGAISWTISAQAAP